MSAYRTIGFEGILGNLRKEDAEAPDAPLVFDALFVVGGFDALFVGDFDALFVGGFDAFPLLLKKLNPKLEFALAAFAPLAELPDEVSPKP